MRPFVFNGDHLSPSSPKTERSERILEYYYDGLLRTDAPHGHVGMSTAGELGVYIVALLFGAQPFVAEVFLTR